MIDRMFIKVMPSIKSIFNEYSLSQQLIVMGVYQKLDIFDAELFDLFLSNIYEQIDIKKNIR